MSIRKVLYIIITAMLLIVILAGCADEEEPGISKIDWNDHDLRAEQFVRALINGDFTIAAEGFDDDMMRALNVRGLKRAWRNTVKIAGEFISIEETELIPNDEYEIYHVVTLHENRNINTRIVFSTDGLIAGLFFSFLES